jgi:hypothetical protein
MPTIFLTFLYIIFKMLVYEPINSLNRLRICQSGPCVIRWAQFQKTEYLISNFIKIIRIYFNINHYENKIGYYKYIYFHIIHHENKLGYYKHR